MIREFLELIKIKQTLLLVYSSIFSYLISSSSDFDLRIFLLLFSAAFFSVSSATVANMIIDIDIDRIMYRTKNRPLVKNSINLKTARNLSISFLIMGLLCGSFINFYIPILILLGFFINVLIYSKMLKRRTILSILMGSISGGLLPLGGTIAYYNKITIEGLLLFSVVYLWSVLHILFISLYYVEDYRRANIPIFSTIFGERKSCMISIPAIILLHIISMMFCFMKKSLITSLIVTVIFVLILTLVYRYYVSENRKYFKYIIRTLNFYLALLFSIPLLEEFV